MDKLNKQELRRLAEAMPALDWDSNFESNEQTGFCCVYAKPFEIDGEMYDGQTFVEICHPEQAKFIAEAKENILSLLDECDGLMAQHSRDSAELRSLCQARDEARRERDQLRAELEQYRKDAERYREIISSAQRLAGIKTKEGGANG